MEERGTTAANEESSESRRAFFGLTGMQVGGAVVAGVVGARWLKQASATASKPLRPPGAASEAEFLAACIRCNQCVEACPIDALRVSRLQTGLATATPYVVAREQPCDLCRSRDEMKCIAVCPTTALQPVKRDHVRMGVAVIDRDICLPWVGVSCKACWHACPFPGEAIVFDELGRALVGEDACVGCGLCEHVCLTDQPAIRIIPQTEWDESSVNASTNAASEETPP